MTLVVDWSSNVKWLTCFTCEVTNLLLCVSVSGGPKYSPAAHHVSRRTREATPPVSVAPVVSLASQRMHAAAATALGHPPWRPTTRWTPAETRPRTADFAWRNAADRERREATRRPAVTTPRSPAWSGPRPSGETRTRTAWGLWAAPCRAAGPGADCGSPVWQRSPRARRVVRIQESPAPGAPGDWGAPAAALRSLRKFRRWPSLL